MGRRPDEVVAGTSVVGDKDGFGHGEHYKLHIKRGGIPGQYVCTEHLLIPFCKTLESSNHKPEIRTVVYIPLSLSRPGYLDICCLLCGNIRKYAHSANIQTLPLNPPSPR
jgi:hypothetical protein